MEKVEYSDIVFLEKMNEIKTTIHSSGFRIDCRRAYEVDQKMRSVVDSLYDENAKDKSLVDLYKKLDMKVNRRSLYTLIYYYYALYHDNLPLLRRILQEDVEIFDENDQFPFELLDRNFSKYFTEDQYIYLIRYCKEELVSFYHSVFGQHHSKMDPLRRRELAKELRILSEKLFASDKVLPKEEKEAYEERLDEISEEMNSSYVCKYSSEEREQYCKKFASIMTKDPFVCKHDKEDVYRSDYYAHLLSPEVFALFDEDQILQMGDIEKDNLSNYTSSPVALERIKRIFEKYPDFHTMIRFDPEILRFFSDEELYHLSPEKIPIYEKACSEGVFSRLKHIESQNQAIIKYPHFIHPTIFESLSDEEISHMSERAIGRINHLVANTKFFNPEEEYRIQRKSVWIMRFDKVIQKVKKILI